MKSSLMTVQGITLNVLSPETLEEAARGLLGLASLSDQTALSYNPAPVLHTNGMQFPIDILWLDSTGYMLLGYEEHVEPGRVIQPASPWALEVMGGWVSRNLKVGS